MTGRLWNSRTFMIAWQITLCLFGLSVMTSKSGLSIFGALLILLSIFALDWKNFFAEEKLAAAIFLLYPLAILCGCFSLGGGASALHTAAAWPWPLLVLPTVIVKRRADDRRLFLTSLATGLAIACLYSFYLFGKDGHWAFGEVRVQSFWDILRWALFVGLALLFLVAVFVDKSIKQIFSSWRLKLLFILLLMDLACVFLSNSRGPWLAFGVSSIALMVLYPKSWKAVIPVLVVFGLVFSYSKSLGSRLSSIGEVQTEQGALTSKDRSNEGRLHMWKVALDFYKEQPWFGTGLENSEEPLRNFVGRQTPEYRDTFTTVEYSFRDQHSSPLTILVQMGLLFFIAFWIVVFWGLWFWIRTWWNSKDLYSAVILSAILFHLVLCIVYSSFLSYELVTFLPLLALKKGYDRD